MWEQVTSSQREGVRRLVSKEEGREEPKQKPKGGVHVRKGCHEAEYWSAEMPWGMPWALGCVFNKAWALNTTLLAVDSAR